MCTDSGTVNSCAEPKAGNQTSVRSRPYQCSGKWSAHATVMLLWACSYVDDCSQPHSATLHKRATAHMLCSCIQTALPLGWPAAQRDLGITRLLHLLLMLPTLRTSLQAIGLGNLGCRLRIRSQIPTFTHAPLSRQITENLHLRASAMIKSTLQGIALRPSLPKLALRRFLIPKPLTRVLCMWGFPKIGDPNI